MTREKFLELVENKARFKMKGDEDFYVDDWGKEMPEKERYSLSKNGTHRANVSGITKSGVRWYAYLFGKRIASIIKFSDITENR